MKKLCLVLVVIMVLTTSMQVFAATDNQSQVAYGDVNSDGKVDSLDYAQLKSYLQGSTELLNVSTDTADLNGDGKIDSWDLALLREYILGNIPYFPVEGRDTASGVLRRNDLEGGFWELATGGGSYVLVGNTSGIEKYANHYITVYGLARPGASSIYQYGTIFEVARYVDNGSILL